MIGIEGQAVVLSPAKFLVIYLSTNGVLCFQDSQCLLFC